MASSPFKSGTGFRRTRNCKKMDLFLTILEESLKLKSESLNAKQRALILIKTYG